MRSKIAQRILDETPKDVEIFVRLYSDITVRINQIYGDWYGKKEFINKCKIDTEFSKKWGLKIEERELNHDERFEIYKKVSGRDLQPHISGVNFKKFHFDEYKIPVKLITLTYNNKTIESYE